MISFLVSHKERKREGERSSNYHVGTRAKVSAKTNYIKNINFQSAKYKYVHNFMC